MDSLPEHLLELIVDRASLPDLIRLGCACKAVKPICGPLKFPNHLPWLIVPRTTTTIKPKSVVFGEQEDVGFYSLCDGKVYKAQIPQLSNRRICGSFPGGWLMTVHHNSEVQLINPFSAKSTVIPLPPLTRFPGVDETLEEDVGAGELYYSGAEYDSRNKYRVDGKRMRDAYIHKVAMSSSSVSKGTVIMTIQCGEGSLAFYTIGENQQAWSRATPKQEKTWFFEDLTYYRGNFYAVNKKGDVVVVLGVETQKANTLYAHPIMSRHPFYHGSELYILESSGDLLVVLRTIFKEKISTPHQTVRFRVLKVKFGTPNQWEEVLSLGNRSLFVGFNQSYSICADDFSGCKPNCIYFTDRTYAGAHLWLGFGGHDFGIFSLEDGSIQKFLYPSDTILVTPPPIWFTPHPCCN